MVAVVVGGKDSLRGPSIAGDRQSRRILWKVLLTVLLIPLGSWTVLYTWPLKSIRFNELEYSEAAARRLNSYPDAQYAYGMQAWIDQQPEMAAVFFRQAIFQDVLFIDAWLRLAETQAAMGQEVEARAILDYVARMTDQVLRWKWPQIVLANQLGMNTRLYRNANDLLTRGKLEQDTIQLLHTHFDGDASAVLAVLAPQNLEAYLSWLMRWGLAEESLAVWKAMTAATAPDKSIALGYAHFLLSHKRISQSTAIWQEYTGSTGLTNPGFENKITGQGFDWRFSLDKNGDCELKRVYSERNEGNYSLRLKFNGKANLSFHHLYQILAVTPNTRYRLAYAWKTRGITTDQGPFVEIVGFDVQGVHVAGPMMTGTKGWHDESIELTVPDGCQAVVVRLRRNTSMRFDSKIRGTLWLDAFRMESVDTGSQDAAIMEKGLFPKS